MTVWVYCSFVANLHWYKLKLPSRLSSEYNCVPFMRYGHTASCIGPKAYIFGGRSDRYGACNFLYSFDTSMFTFNCIGATIAEFPRLSFHPLNWRIRNSDFSLFSSQFSRLYTSLYTLTIRMIPNARVV